MWLSGDTISRRYLVTVEVIHHCQKTHRIDIQKYTSILVLEQPLLSSPSEQSLQPLLLNLCQSVPGHGFDLPPCINSEGLRSIDIKHLILIGEGLLILPQFLESLCDLIPRFPRDILGLLEVIYQPFHCILWRGGCWGNFFHGDNKQKIGSS